MVRTGREFTSAFRLKRLHCCGDDSFVLPDGILDYLYLPITDYLLSDRCFSSLHQCNPSLSSPIVPMVLCSFLAFLPQSFYSPAILYFSNNMIRWKVLIEISPQPALQPSASHLTNHQASKPFPLACKWIQNSQS